MSHFRSCLTDRAATLCFRCSSIIVVVVVVAVAVAVVTPSRSSFNLRFFFSYCFDRISALSSVLSIVSALLFLFSFLLSFFLLICFTFFSPFSPIDLLVSLPSPRDSFPNTSHTTHTPFSPSFLLSSFHGFFCQEQRTTAPPHTDKPITAAARPDPLSWVRLWRLFCGLLPGNGKKPERHTKHHLDADDDA